MAKQRIKDELPRTKTTVELRDDLLERIPRSFTLTNALEPLLEQWLANESGIKVFRQPMKRVWSGDTLTPIEALAEQIIETVAEIREPTTADGGEGDGGARQGAEAQGPGRGGQRPSEAVQPTGNAKTRKKVG